ncbi:hypothetical protein Fmac_031875 [Flemingia macrophylla]|uniref:Uncharacterized protein n=1 Tax=Flemingia macrophylla TaxID=520843 RepID=A0ABD1L3B3_9FABA
MLVVVGVSWDLNWFLQLLLSVIVVVVGVHIFVKTTASASSPRLILSAPSAPRPPPRSARAARPSAIGILPTFLQSSIAILINHMLRGGFAEEIHWFCLFEEIWSGMGRNFEGDHHHRQHHLAAADSLCAVCATPASKRCSRCKAVRYWYSPYLSSIFNCHPYQSYASWWFC